MGAKPFGVGHIVRVLMTFNERGISSLNRVTVIIGIQINVANENKSINLRDDYSQW